MDELVQWLRDILDQDQARISAMLAAALCAVTLIFG